MDGITNSENTRGHSNVRWILLLWCLTGVQFRPGLSADTENNREEGLAVFIAGPDHVTVGVPCSFECAASCPSGSCTYSMAVDKQESRAQGDVLAFTLRQWAESLTLTCTATDDRTGALETATKKLQVLAGPANVSISGPDMMSPMASHSYSCHAYCRPSCNYTWKVGDGPWVAGQGDVIGVTPREQDTSKTLMCKVTNTVSGLWAAKVQDIAVTSGLSEAHINGPDTMQLGRSAKFVCLADCVPSCRYTWTVGDHHTLSGSGIEITVDQPLKSVTLRCEAQNTLTGKSTTVSKTIWLGDHSLATRPEERSTLLLCAFIASAVILI